MAHTLAAVQAAANVPTMRSFVLTSSSSAAYLAVPKKEGTVINEGISMSIPPVCCQGLTTDGPNFLDTWNDEAVAAAWNKETRKEDLPYIVYAASKAEGERALWRFVKETKPSFAVNTVLPSANVSPVLLYLATCNAIPATVLYMLTASWLSALVRRRPFFGDRGQHHGISAAIIIFWRSWGFQRYSRTYVVSAL